MVDTADLKSSGPKRPCGFDSRPGYKLNFKYMIAFIILTALFVVLGIPLLIGYSVDPDGFRDDVKNFFDCFRKYDIQKQMSFFQEATWVQNVINSCTDRIQLLNARKLIKLLVIKYKGSVKNRVINETREVLAGLVDNKLWSYK